jgi:CubicO group peptidase (beta-lactamase class C family)
MGFYLTQIIIFTIFSCSCSRQAVEQNPAAALDVTELASLRSLGNKTLTYKEMKNFLGGLMQEYSITALSVAISQNRDTYLLNLGFVDAQYQKPVDDKTVFQAGYLGQPVFASLVLQLCAEQIINLDEPLYKYLKHPLTDYLDYKDLKGDPRYKRLTARRILSHQSGFPYSRRMNLDGRLDFKYSPGKQFGFSVEGYRLLQFVLEELTGRSINDLAKEKVFDPLSMRQSSFLWEPRFEGNLALGTDAALISTVLSSREKASVAESFLTTASDYMKFMQEEPWGGWPEVSITSRSIFSAPNTDGRALRPKRLSWTLMWGYYLRRGQYVNFHGSREKEHENYASTFYLNGMPAAAIVILSSTSNGKTFTARILKELMADTSAPLDWLDFKGKYRNQFEEK